jgi:hypothetical protein
MKMLLQQADKTVFNFQLDHLRIQGLRISHVAQQNSYTARKQTQAFTTGIDLCVTQFRAPNDSPEDSHRHLEKVPNDLEQ